jgi:dolichol-phosphate mannosyltransferase
VLRDTHRRLLAVLELMPLNFELIYVDDGSTDSTTDLLRQLQAFDNRVRVVRLSRNFGHQIAITAGLQHSSGDAVVVIDADLQDPPEVIGEFVRRWRQGFRWQDLRRSKLYLMQESSASRRRGGPPSWTCAARPRAGN